MLGEVFMSYKEIKHPDCSFRREWRTEDGRIHREDGPAVIYYYPDGSIKTEAFYINGKFLGTDKEGFWKLWDRLIEDKRQSCEILKCSSKF